MTLTSSYACFKLQHAVQDLLSLVAENDTQATERVVCLGYFSSVIGQSGERGVSFCVAFWPSIAGY